ncbi:MAG: tyrosine-type recombinase/integrase [Lachnospiraceae bacterium]|nr:tyrosine-type recombinase/integrase [Lachnospiraceae bacterium]MBQ2405080.1 tyrosine-type recombinase/integrase [Lachnospiraceae bacterium]
MPNKKTVALTREQYENIIEAMRTGSYFFRPNEQIMTCLILEANLGLRIEDILNLRLSSIIKDGDRYRLDIIEKKTQKKRTFTVPYEIFEFISAYCTKNDIAPTDLIFKTKERNVQTYLQKVAYYLGYENIGTHSFRKFFATEIYINNGYNIVLVQQLLQHSSTSITQRYIGIGSEQLEEALRTHICLPKQ